MADMRLCLEALSALSGCTVESTSGASQLSPQDFVNIVALREFYKQEGLKELEYPNIGTLSLVDTTPALAEGPSTASVEVISKTTVLINPQDFFHRLFDYDFTHIQVSLLDNRGEVS